MLAGASPCCALRPVMPLRNTCTFVTRSGLHQMLLEQRTEVPAASRVAALQKLDILKSN